MISLFEPNRRVVDRLTERGTYRRWVMGAALAGMFSTSFPITILSVSLRDIAVEFDTTTSFLTWVITLPMLLSAMSVGVLGKMGDLRGHRRVFLIGFGVATCIAAATPLATGPVSLIALRCGAQVIGAATQPAALALTFLVFDREDRVKAVGYWQLVVASAPSLGLALGGPLVGAFGWRSVFVVQAGLSAVAFVAALVLLPETKPKADVRFDVPGAISLTAAVGAVVFAIAQAPSWGLDHPLVMAAMMAAPIGFAVFGLVERTVPAPLVDPTFFGRRDFTFPLLSFFFQGSVYMGGFVLLPLAFRDVFGLSTAQTALIMVLRTGIYSVSSPLGGQLGARIGARTTSMFGVGMLLASMLIAIGALSTGAVVLMGAALVVMGAGTGIARPSLAASVANSVPDTDLGIAAALQRMANQIGNVFGITLLTALYDGSGTAEGFIKSFTVGAILGIFALISVSRLSKRPTPRSPANA